MKDYIFDRAISMAHYIIDNKATVRSTAAKFNISKSTVHMDVANRLWDINRSLAKEVKAILGENKADRHIRGGLATKEKYEKLKQV